MAPTGTGKTMSPIALSEKHKIIFVCAARHVGLALAKAAISVGNGVSSTHKDFVAGFLAATGKVVEVSENLQDAVTATSGSGPAYFFAFVEAMIEGAMALGLSKEVATELTVQTFVGSAKLLEESGKSATTLRENVTSPNGTTAAALASFSANDLSNLVSQAMESARNRSIELA